MTLTKIQMNARLKAYETVLQAIASWDYPQHETTATIRARRVLELFGVEPMKGVEAEAKADQLLDY